MKRIIVVLIAMITLLIGLISVYADNTQITWDCSCGAKGNTGNFCPNCGNKSPIWVCPECGSTNDQNFCPNCGSAKAEEDKSDTKTIDAEYENTIGGESSSIKSEIENLKKLVEQGDEDAKEKLQDYQFLYVEQLIDNNTAESYIEACSCLKELKEARYAGASDKLSEVYTKMLGKGKYAYYKGDYETSKKYLKYLESNNSTAESKLYYTMSRVRAGDYFSNSMYRLLVNHIDEADAKEVLICNQFGANWFLTGYWKDATGKYMDFSNVLNENLPSVLQGEKKYWIEKGILYVYTDQLDEKKQDKRITVIDKNTIEILCYSSNETYVINRAS